PAGCTSTATSSASWLTVTGGASGSGNHTISYSASSNNGGAGRSATITAGGKIFTVTQVGSCTYTLGTSSTAPLAAGGANSVAMTAAAGSTWTASSDSPSWLKILSGSGNGNGWVTYNVVANKGGTRTGRITAGGKTLTVTQTGPGVTAAVTAPVTASSEGCTYQLGRTSSTSTAAGGVDSVKMMASSGCAWHATSDSSWLAV